MYFQYLIQISLLLLQLSNLKHSFHGYNYLTLAMLRGNVRLVEVFLKFGNFDPNEVLKTHGTPLHVLVSTFLQTRVPFEESLKIVSKALVCFKGWYFIIIKITNFPV